MKSFFRFAIVLVALQWLLLDAPRSETRPEAKIDDEFAKQDVIYKSRGEQRPSGYVIDRSLASYSETLPSDFAQTLGALRDADRWLDIGAGSGQAILDYLNPEGRAVTADSLEKKIGKAQAVAVSIEDRRTDAWNQMVSRLGGNQLKYLASKPVREYSPRELGKFHIITDVIGGFSYTEYLSVYMERVLSLLELNGRYYSVLQDVHSENGANKPHYKGAPFLTEISGTNGTELKVCSWLKGISCVEVTCEFRTGWTPPIEVYQVRKVCDAVSVPKLELVHYQAGTPPERGFRLSR